MRLQKEGNAIAGQLREQRGPDTEERPAPNQKRTVYITPEKYRQSKRIGFEQVVQIVCKYVTELMTTLIENLPKGLSKGDSSKKT